MVCLEEGGVLECRISGSRFLECGAEFSEWIFHRMMRVNGMGKILHCGKGEGFYLLSHNVLDALGKTRVILVAEHGVVPACLNGKTVKSDIISDNWVVHSWPFSSIFHPFLTSFLGSFSLYFTLN